MRFIVVEKPKWYQTRLKLLIWCLSLCISLAGIIGSGYAYMGWLSLSPSWEAYLAIAGTVGSVATLVGLFIALWQIVLVRRQAIDAADTARQTKAAVDTVLQNVRQDLRYHVAAEARHYFELAQERIRTGAIGPDKGDWNEAIIRLHDTARQLEFLEPLEDVSADQHMWADVVDDLNSVCKAIQSLLTSLRRKLTKDQQDILDRVAENFWKGIKKHNRRVIGSTYDTSEEEDESDVDERTV